MEQACFKYSDETKRRMMFAVQYLPPEIPKYWEIVAKFASQTISKECIVSPEAAKLVMENLQVLNPGAFISDQKLTQEIIKFECAATKQPLGVPLIPNQTKCSSCDGKLLLRGDRPSRLSLDTESLGTVPATHFYKYCQKYRKGCKFVQYYGYHKTTNNNAQYSSNWSSLTYFISSQETAFEMKLLRQFDIELLIGQISYKQKADIYNILNGYDTTKKGSVVSFADADEKKFPVHGYDTRVAIVLHYLYLIVTINNYYSTPIVKKFTTG